MTMPSSSTSDSTPATSQMSASEHSATPDRKVVGVTTSARRFPEPDFCPSDSEKNGPGRGAEAGKKVIAKGTEDVGGGKVDYRTHWHTGRSGI